MPKCLIVYFSQGGTTVRVAEAIASGMQLAEYKVDMCNIRNESPPEIRGYDLLGVGLPVYWYRPPFNVMDYLNGLPELNALPAFVFVLYGTYRGDTSTIIRRLLARKGAREVGYFCCRGDDTFLGYLKMGYLFSPGHPVEGEIAQAKDFGKTLGITVDRGQYVKPKEDEPPAAVYRLERFLANRWMCKNIFSRLFIANVKKCNRCGLCIKLCPTRNVTEGKDGYPKWGRNCMMCFTCELKCPKDAIGSPIDWPIFRPLLYYNVRRASRDRSLDHVRVIHIGGQTKLV
jgi:flavodoxin/Pyruvate/2-oxoacid:ferredoxin oxidoreductase delta subunit